MPFQQSRSVYAGLSQPALQAALASAQAALIALQTGAQVAKISYGEGSGMKAVEYRRADLGGLVQMINELQACLGQRRTARRGFRMSF